MRCGNPSTHVGHSFKKLLLSHPLTTQTHTCIHKSYTLQSRTRFFLFLRFLCSECSHETCFNTMMKTCTTSVAWHLHATAYLGYPFPHDTRHTSQLGNNTHARVGILHRHRNGAALEVSIPLTGGVAASMYLLFICTYSFLFSNPQLFSHNCHPHEYLCVCIVLVLPNNRGKCPLTLGHFFKRSPSFGPY